MKRVAMVGCSGGGKSRLARRLAEKTGLPVVHIDQEYWLPGWIAPPLENWRVRHAELIAELEWIIDGNSPNTLAARVARADMVVFLDMPRWRCLLRVLWRLLTTFGKVREDMAPGCPERFDLEFLRYIWTFKLDQEPRILEAFEKRSDACEVVRLSSTREVEGWLTRISGGIGNDATL